METHLFFIHYETAFVDTPRDSLIF